MRIIHLGPFPIESTIIKGGVEASVFGLALEQSKGSQVYVIDAPRLDGSDSAENGDNITVYRFKNPGPHQRDAIKRVDDIIRIIIDISPSICHIHGTSMLSYTLVKALRSYPIPIVLTVHGLASIEKRNALKKHFSLKALYQCIYQSYYERKVLNYQKDVIVDTEYVARAIKDYRLRKTPNMTVIPQGIDERFYHINCSTSSKNILSVGSISRRKGHILLVQAFSIAAEELKDIHLVICGVLADMDYYNELKQFIDTLPCRDRISLKPNLPKEELILQYSEAHLFALHSQEESQGIVFAEAMATGLPVVATSVGGVPDVVKVGVSGILSDYGDIKTFASYLVSLLCDNHKWSMMSDNSRTAAKAYSWNIIKDSIDNIYRTLL